MTTILMNVNGRTTNVNVETAKLSKEQQAELKALGVDGVDTAVRFASGTIQDWDSGTLEKAEQAAVKAQEIHTALQFS